MSLKFSLLLSPVFSKYDVLESGIVNIYLKKALDQVFPTQQNYILNLMLDTPWLLYQTYGLYNPTRSLIDPSEAYIGNGPQQTIMILAFTSVLVSHMNNSDIVFVNGNGPVVNEGFSSMIGLASAMGKRLVYWKDDARRLWGFNDNPITIGLMPSISDHLVDPAGFPTHLNLFDPSKPNNCGATVLPQLVQKLVSSMTPPENIKLSTEVNNLITLGNALNASFAQGNPDGITWSTILTDPLKSYKKIKAIFLQNISTLSSIDYAYLKNVLNGSPSPLTHLNTYTNMSNIKAFSSKGPLQTPAITSTVINILDDLRH